MRQIFVTQDFAVPGEPHPDAEFGLRRAKSRAKYEQERVDERLREAIAGDGEMSVAQIAFSLNLEPVTVWRRSNALAKRAAQKHAQFVARRSAEGKAGFVSRARALASQYKAAGVTPTSADFKRDLGDPGCGINPWKRSVIDDILAEVFDWRYMYQSPAKGEEDGNA
ncbi:MULTISPECIES: hypothetical protein [unclassified Caballeronia]|uniref:hypothetical protein n=1 Tax=unclassified Caballeronia TaxID=2646786 RepID=UPI0020294D55|nr:MULTISPECIES: hypothetical protein [unclassified Caballeronia]MDR5768095.1 hypothetical protein [Caballeronia sp. LZ028]